MINRKCDMFLLYSKQDIQNFAYHEKEKDKEKFCPLCLTNKPPFIKRQKFLNRIQNTKTCVLQKRMLDEKFRKMPFNIYRRQWALQSNLPLRKRISKHSKQKQHSYRCYEYVSSAFSYCSSSFSRF